MRELDKNRTKSIFLFFSNLSCSTRARTHTPNRRYNVKSFNLATHISFWFHIRYTNLIAVFHPVHVHLIMFSYVPCALSASLAQHQNNQANIVLDKNNDTNERRETATTTKKEKEKKIVEFSFSDVTWASCHASVMPGPSLLRQLALPLCAVYFLQSHCIDLYAIISRICLPMLMMSAFMMLIVMREKTKVWSLNCSTRRVCVCVRHTYETETKKNLSYIWFGRICSSVRSSEMMPTNDVISFCLLYFCHSSVL